MKPESRPEAADPVRLLHLPTERELPGSRHRLLKEYLMQEIAEDIVERTSGERVRARRPRRRLAGIAVPVAAACAVLAVVAVSGAGGTAGGGATVHGATNGSSTGTVGGTAGGSPAAQLLGRIANVADSQPVPHVRGGQFVYVASKESFEVDTQDSSGYHSTLAPLHLRQIWLSVDDSQAGLLRENGQDMSLPVSGAPDIDDPDYNFLQSLPTDPATLLQQIYTDTKGEGQANGPDAEAFATIGDLMREQIAPPAVSAALYKAAAMIPDVRVINGVVDGTGRHDVAVALDNSAATNEWLFDPSTLQFVGQQTVSLQAGSLGPAGTVVGTQLVLTRTFVDHAGEVPTGTAG